jgi:hypothetical protein
VANQSQKIQVTANIQGVTGSVVGSDTESGNTLISLVDQNFPAASANTPVTLAFTLANLQSIVLLSDKGCTLKTNLSGTGTPDVQTISISGTPTGGIFSVDFRGQTTIIAFNATAATVQAALRALSTIGGTNVTCTGGPLPGTPVVCTFSGTLATGKQPLMTAYSGALTGGTTPTVTVAHTTSGTPSDTITLQPGIPLIWGVSMGIPNPFTSDVASAAVSNTPAQRLKIQGVSL